VALTHCPHCGAENFTMEGWEDLDHCSSCGEPLGEVKRGRFKVPEYATLPAEPGRGESLGGNRRDAKRPRPA
jgi:ribosomal protein L34E